MEKDVIFMSNIGSTWNWFKYFGFNWSEHLSFGTAIICQSDFYRQCLSTMSIVATHLLISLKILGLFHKFTNWYGISMI